MISVVDNPGLLYPCSAEESLGNFIHSELLINKPCPENPGSSTDFLY